MPPQNKNSGSKGTRRKEFAGKHRDHRTPWLRRWTKRFAIGSVLLIAVGLGAAWMIRTDAPARAQAALGEAAIRASANMGFVVERVEIEGRVNTDPGIIRALLNTRPGDPIFAFDPDEAHDVLSRISWVRAVTIQRRFPDEIYIRLEERKPFALWHRQGQKVLVDRHGVILSDHDLARFEGLPFLRGEGAPDKAAALFAMLGAEPRIAGRFNGAVRIGQRRWDLILENGIRVKLPAEDMGLALARLADAQKQDKLMDKNIATIDLRMEDRIVIRTKPGAVRDYKAGLRL